MPLRYETFDAEEVLFETRRSVARLGRIVLSAVVVTILALIAGARFSLAPLLVGGSLVGIWFSVVAYVAHQMRRLRRVTWCLKLSDQGIEGYDYARRRIRLRWEQVRRVALTGSGLLIVGSEHCRIRVPDRFSDFPELSHRVVRHAERRGIPLFIDGRPLEDIDVYALFPFLADDPSSDASAPRGSTTA